MTDDVDRWAKSGDGGATSDEGEQDDALVKWCSCYDWPCTTATDGVCAACGLPVDPKRVKGDQR